MKRLSVTLNTNKDTDVERKGKLGHRREVKLVMPHSHVAIDPEKKAQEGAVGPEASMQGCLAEGFVSFFLS